MRPAPHDPDAGIHQSTDSHEQQEEYELNRLDNMQTGPTPLGPSITTRSENATHTVPKSPRTIASLLSRTCHVPIASARDHLANERVFLAYVRTSNAFANFAMIIVQLYRLNRNGTVLHKLGYYKLGIPLAVVVLVIAITTVAIGAMRFFTCQNAMLKKRVLGSGWVVVVFSTGTCLVSR